MLSKEGEYRDSSTLLRCTALLLYLTADDKVLIKPFVILIFFSTLF